MLEAESAWVPRRPLRHKLLKEQGITHVRSCQKQPIGQKSKNGSDSHACRRTHNIQDNFLEATRVSQVKAPAKSEGYRGTRIVETRIMPGRSLQEG